MLEIHTSLGVLYGYGRNTTAVMVQMHNTSTEFGRPVT